MRKSPFCTKLTQVMDFKETETHCGQSPVMIHNTSNKGIWPKNISNSMHGIKSAYLEIANLALLIPFMEFEIFCGQIPSFELLWICHYWTLFITYLSLFQIRNLRQFCAKRSFYQKDIHTSFPFLFLSVRLSY